MQKRSWNGALWSGFLLVLAGFFGYGVLVRFPVTRDFPWVNLLFFAAGGACLLAGLFRAFGKPARYRGKIFGPIVTVLSLGLVSVFSYSLFYVVRQLPASTGAPQVGQKAPDFTLPDQNGDPVTLSNLVASGHGTVLIFYRGRW